jgi:hypothetical protein
MSEAYRYFHGHQFHRRETARGQRQQSKVIKAVKRLASLDLLDAVAQEDARRRREREQGRGALA